METNRVTLFVPGEDPEPWPLLPKRLVADRLLDRAAALLLLRDALPPMRDDGGAPAGAELTGAQPTGKEST
jgi:hypothetical protein